VGKFLTSDMERFGGKGVVASESVTVTVVQLESRRPHAKNNKTMVGGRSREGEGFREEARTLRRLRRARTCPELCAEIGVSVLCGTLDLACERAQNPRTRSLRVGVTETEV
jgi:hypothetical protein